MKKTQIIFGRVFILLTLAICMAVGAPAAFCGAFTSYAEQSTGGICEEGEHRFKVRLTHMPQENAEGEREYVCEICGYSYTERIPSTGHEWGEWIVDAEPTDTSEGHRYRVCTRYPESPHYEEEVIPMLVSGAKEDKETPGSAVKNAALLAGAFNSLDLAAGAAVIGITLWYAVVLWPLIEVLIWADKKRRAIKKELNL